MARLDQADTLPEQPCSAQPREAAETLRGVVDRRPRRGIGHSACDDARRARLRPAPADAILVVDDEESLRDLVTTALSSSGYEVAEAVDGLDALAVVPDFGADLIVLDVNMPGLDGFEVCRRLRADGDTTPVIFLTARDTQPGHRSTASPPAATTT